MDEQLFGEGYRVTINSCTHRVMVQIQSYASSRLAVNPAGTLTFEVNDLTPLYDAMIPTKLTAQMLGSLLGFSAPPEELHDGEFDLKSEQTLLFSDEVTLELWLRQEFLPHLDVFEGDEVDEDKLEEEINEMVRQIMSDTLGNKAKESVRRSWRA